MENKKIIIHCFGCKVNQYEAQALREYFSSQGFIFTDKLGEAGTLLVHSCTVTGEADRQCRQLIRKSLRLRPGLRVLVAGCYAERSAMELEAISHSVSVIGRSALHEALKAGISDFAGHSRAFVKIQDGCDAFCSYCIVPHVRSRMTSRPVEEALTEINRLAEKGYPEIVLTGVRLGKYSGGIEKLILRIAGLRGNFRIRLSSLEPWEVTEELLAIMRDRPDRICCHLHIPMQSGSDKILKKMNRPYSSGTFGDIAQSVKEALPDAGLSTDIIVGFPGETDADFSRTEELAGSLGFSRLHVFRYSKREGTPACRFGESVDTATARERSSVLRQLDARLQKNFWKKFAGTVRPVVREEGKNTLLTDNYIRLRADPKTICNYNKIFNAAIRNVDGLPYGIPTGN